VASVPLRARAAWAVPGLPPPFQGAGPEAPTEAQETAPGAAGGLAAAVEGAAQLLAGKARAAWLSLRVDSELGESRDALAEQVDAGEPEVAVGGAPLWEREQRVDSGVLPEVGEAGAGEERHRLAAAGPPKARWQNGKPDRC
jgi:hypothetical protein